VEGHPGRWQGDVGTLFHEAKANGWRDDGTHQKQTPEEVAERERKALEAEAEREQARAGAATRAATTWRAARPAPDDHPYLVRKRIKANGARLYNGALVIPLRADGDLYSLQFIEANGDKKFLTGGRVAGCYFSIGTTKGAAALCIAEGFATGATIHEATGYPVAVAFNAGNLLAVAKTMREKFPAPPVILCADDDYQTEGNPGLTKATEAARSVGGLLAIPDFGTNRPDGATDFNDLHQAQGLEAVKHAITGALTSGDAMTLPEQTNTTGDAVGAHKANIPQVQITCAANIKPEPIRWLWDGWLARGKFHIFAGQAGTGKTTIAIALAATVSIGGRFPDGTRAPVGNVLIWSGEDSAKDTLVPRLLAAGADMAKVHFIGDVQHRGEVRSFDPATDIKAMMDAAERIGDVVLLLVDPVVNAVAGDSHKNGEVRRALQPLVDFGEKLDCAVLGISHFSKGTGGKDPMERVTGSLAFAALARVVLATGKINEGGKVKRIFCRAKSNIGLDSGGFEYDLHQKELDDHKGVFSSYALGVKRWTEQRLNCWLKTPEKMKAMEQV
jgi:putative DNA primase/helicase